MTCSPVRTAVLVVACLSFATLVWPQDVEPPDTSQSGPNAEAPPGAADAPSSSAPLQPPDNAGAQALQRPPQKPRWTPPSTVHGPWSVFYYHSEMTDNSVWQVLEDRSVVFKFGSLDSIDVEYELDHENPVRKFFRPLVSTIQVGGAATVHHDRNHAFEISPYIMFRWRKLPLQRYLLLTIGVGEGVSFASAVPAREARGLADGRQVLDFMALELTLALPSHPQIEIVPRIHHRSSAWGTFGESRSSNALGLGVRYLFGRYH